MEPVKQEVSTESVAAPVVNSAPVVESTTSSVDKPVADPNAAIPTTEEAVWTPNLKYKVGKEEKDFDPLFKELVKSAEHEKKLKDLYERADGLELVKQSRDSYKKHLEDISGKYEPVTKELTQLGVFFKKDDYDSAFKMLGIPEQKIIDYVASKLQYNLMLPEERARVDAQRRLQEENYGKSSEVENLRNQIQQQEVQNLQFQLQVLQESTKWVDASSSFDTRVGKPGSFENKFLEIGDYLSSLNGGKTVPPNQVLDLMMKEYGLEQGASASQELPPQSKPVVSAMPAKPIIKSINGSKTATPVKSKPRSLEDLKKLQREMAGSSYEEGQR